MDNKEQCRAEFEYWHRGEFGYFEPLLDYAGEYAAKDIEGRWKSWQASRATSPAPAVVQMTDEQINWIVREVAELPDRDSPPDQPEMMLVSADELRAILSASGVKNG